jgi:5'-nucleotidase
MTVLVTNDDGSASPGLACLYEAMTDISRDVTVVAPTTERSGSSASLGSFDANKGISVQESSADASLLQVRRFSVDAPPALAVRAVCSELFGRKPRVVVSGINSGFNTGRLVIHSGTAGAVLTAASLGVSGVAISTSSGAEDGLITAAAIAKIGVRAIEALDYPAVALNINVPDLPPHAVRGVRFATLGTVSLTSLDITLTDGKLLCSRKGIPPPYDVGSDSNYVSLGFISVTLLPLPWQVVHHVEDELRLGIEAGWNILHSSRFAGESS